MVNIANSKVAHLTNKDCLETTLGAENDSISFPIFYTAGSLIKFWLCAVFHVHVVYIWNKKIAVLKMDWNIDGLFVYACISTERQTCY